MEDLISLSSTRVVHVLYLDLPDIVSAMSKASKSSRQHLQVREQLRYITSLLDVLDGRLFAIGTNDQRNAAGIGRQCKSGRTLYTWNLLGLVFQICRLAIRGLGSSKM